MLKTKRDTNRICETTCEAPLATDLEHPTLQTLFQKDSCPKFTNWSFLALSLAVFLSTGSLTQVFAQVATTVPPRESMVESTLTKIDFMAAKSSQATWTIPEPETVQGRVVDFNGSNIVYQIPPDESLRTRPSSDVAKLTFQWAADEAAAAQVAFDNRAYAEGIRLGKNAIASGNLPSWQQRLLVAKMVDAFWWSNQRVLAGKLFLSLIKDSSPLLVYTSAPLIWQSTKMDSVLTDAATEAATGWLKESGSLDAQLLGASWLLGTSSTTEAIEVLEKISQQSNVQLARLATAQQWRVATPKEVAKKYTEWRAVRDLLPVALQAGPTLTIAEKLERASLQSDALQEYIRILAIEPGNSHSSEIARKQAVEILRSLNRPDEANKLLTSS
jgi:hypothetical protein